MRHTLGNLGADLILADVRRPAGSTRADPPRHPLLDDLKRIRDLGFLAIEDYVGWRVIEPSAARPDLSRHIEHRGLVEQAGLQYVIYPWVHAVPPWADDHALVARARCLQHDRETCALSLFDPKTDALFRHVYELIARELGHPDGVTVAMPGDYGEVGHPVGFGTWALTADVDHTHAHVGYWCGDETARRSYRDSLLHRFGDVSAINRAFATSFHGTDALRPPSDPERSDLPPALREHFLEWYRGSVTSFLDRTLTLARATFPNARLAFKCGYAGEMAAYGIVPHDLALLAKRHRAELWSTHGGLPVVFHKRYQGLCRTFGVPYVTEAITEPDRDAVLDRLFEDASEGVSGVFEFYESFRAHEPDFTQHLEKIRGTPPTVDVVLLFRDTALLLEPGLAFPPGLTALAEPLRDLIDYEVLDEMTLLVEGAMSRHLVLAVPDPGPMNADAIDAIHDFASGGGIVVIPRGVPIVDRNGRSPYAALDGVPVVARELLRWPPQHHPHDTPLRLCFDGADAWRIFGDFMHIEAATPYFGGLCQADARCRWIGARAGFRLPVSASNNRRVELVLYAPADARPEAWRVSVDGVVCDIRLVAGAQIVTLVVPDDGRAAIREIELEGPTFRPGRSGDVEDRRDLGLLLLEARANGGLPLTPTGPDEEVAEIDIEAAQRAFTPIGAGGVLSAPVGDPLALGLLIHHACRRRSTLIPGANDIALPPPQRGGLRLTRFRDRVLVYNRSPRDRSLDWPEELDAPLHLRPGELKEAPRRRAAAPEPR